jgi:hypothetical protein
LQFCRKMLRLDKKQGLSIWWQKKMPNPKP